MEIHKDAIPANPSGCAAAALRELVDGQINEGAIREFNDATSELQGPGADLGPGSAYLRDSEIRFTSRVEGCAACLGSAILNADGSVRAPACGLTGLCEFGWACKYPEKYRDVADGAMGGKLGCGAEVGCSAQIGVKDQNGTPVPVLLLGSNCEVERRGIPWKARRDRALGGEELVNPDHGIPAFDGLDSGREEQEE